MTTVAPCENIRISRTVDPFVSHRSALLSLHDWLTPHAQGVGDFAFFKLISEYFDHKIDQFGLRLMTRMKIAVLLWVNKALNGILGSAAEGMTTQAMFQGGIGLLMTVLIVTAPPLAAAYFQGTLGNFMSYSAFAGKDPGKDRNAEVAAPPTQKIENETKTGGVSRPETGYMGGKNGENLPQQDKVKNTPRDKD